jgi:arsenite methyltransferase
MAKANLAPESDRIVKASCACLYETDIARYLLGDSYHPGGLELTAHVGGLLGLANQSRLLDVASGNGTSALFLARRFGCAVRGIDYSLVNVERSNARAAADGLSDCVAFTEADGEAPPFADGSFDAVLCECSFCLFPNKDAAARSFSRLLRPGGRAVISDVTRRKTLPKSLSGLVARIACIADARPTDEYVACLRRAGLTIEAVEEHDEALSDLVKEVQLRLIGAEVLVGLNKLRIPDVNFATAREMATEALVAIRQRQLGYTVILAAKTNAPADVSQSR